MDKDNGPANPGNPGQPADPRVRLVADCAEAAVRAGGTPGQIATRAAACAVAGTAHLAGSPGATPPASHPTPGSTDTGAPAEK